MRDFKGKSLLKQQIGFFHNNGIKTLYIVTQHTPHMNELLLEIENAPIDVKILERNVKGNADALAALKDRLNQNFIVMSGNTYNNFDLLRMIKKHLDLGKLVTMGLMGTDKPSKCENAVLDEIGRAHV